jgi:hypothetical protein
VQAHCRYRRNTPAARKTLQETFGANRERREFEHKGAYELLEIAAQIEAAEQGYVE